MDSRLFIAINIDCPWPQNLPKGRMLKEEDRHLTLSFLGQQDEQHSLDAMKKAPKYSALLAPAGYFDDCIFLPKRSPNVVAWHAEFEIGGDAAFSYQKKLEQFLADEKILKEPEKNTKEHATWLPHVTLCRQPFEKEAWSASFEKLPFVAMSCALYKSLGNLNYQMLYEEKWLQPFEKLPHTADLAYIVRGASFEELFKSAHLALAFTHPPLLAYKRESNQQISSLEEVIFTLNRFVTEEDTNVGCPMKAVSYHSLLNKREDLMEWEMIIDV